MSSLLPDPSGPDAFGRWETALSALEEAEAWGDPDVHRLALSEAVIRARAEFTAEAIADAAPTDLAVTSPTSC